MIHFRVRYERLRDRLIAVRRRARWLRAARWSTAVFALALLVDAALARSGLDRMPAWAWGLAVFIVGVAVALPAILPEDGTELARALDRRFGLGELLVTAVEVDERGPRSTMERRLLDDAATAVARIGGDGAIHGDRVRREAHALGAACSVALGLALLGPWMRGVPLPPIAQAPAGPAGVGLGDEAVAGRGGASGRAPDRPTREMTALSSELGEHATLGEVARGLNEGRVPAAADAMRVVADRAAEMSEAGRADLAEVLRSAAAGAEGDAGLRSALERAAGQLDDAEVDPRPALAELADRIGGMAAARGAARAEIGLDEGEGVAARPAGRATGRPTAALGDGRVSDRDGRTVTEGLTAGASEGGRGDPSASSGDASAADRTAGAGGERAGARPDRRPEPPTGDITSWREREVLRRFFSWDAGIDGR